MARCSQLDYTNAITGIFCSLRGSVQGRSTESGAKSAVSQDNGQVWARHLAALKSSGGNACRITEIKVRTGGLCLHLPTCSWVRNKQAKLELSFALGRFLLHHSSTKKHNRSHSICHLLLLLLLFPFLSSGQHF